MTDSERFEFFVSHVVMTENANPLGHSFMLLSCIDHAKGDNATVDVIEAVGFYSTYYPMMGFKLQGPGQIKLEKPRDIALINGMSHQTFKITQDEMGKLLTLVNEDRRLNPTPNPYRTHRNEYRPGGPYFDAYRGQNCKNYVLGLLQRIGIAIDPYQSFLQIPRLSRHLTSIYLSVKPDENRYYWQTPLFVTPRTERAFASDHARWRLWGKFAIYRHETQHLLTQLQARQTYLLSLNRKMPVLDTTITQLQYALIDFEKNQLYPNRLTQTYLDTLIEKTRQPIEQYKHTIMQTHFSGSTVFILRELLLILEYCREWLEKCHLLLHKPSTCTTVTPHRADHHMIHSLKFKCYG